MRILLPRLGLLCLTAWIIGGEALPASAKFCGDDIGGTRVACDCGDVVISDTRLEAGDPVVNRRCSLDGLVVAPSFRRESLTLDLNGLTISGDLYGVGIRVESGGASGAVLRGAGSGRAYGQVVGFMTGIASRSFGSVARIEGVEVHGARSHGVSLRGRGVLLVDVTAIGNGGDGVHLVGHGGRLVRVSAFANAKNGVVVLADAPIVEASAERNGGHGVVVRGRGATLGEIRALANGGVGLLAPETAESGAVGAVASFNGKEDRRLAAPASQEEP